jgi:hypothetical protein
LFSSADNVSGNQVILNYSTTVTATGPATGQQIVLNQQLLGTTPTFGINFYTTFQGNPMTITAPVCVASKLGFGTKLEDFAMPEFDFSLQANAANQVLTWTMGDNA